MELTKVLGKMSCITQAAVPRKIQNRYLQTLQIQAMIKTNSYQEKSEPVFAPLKNTNSRNDNLE